MSKTYLQLENFNNQKIVSALNILIKATLRRSETLDHCLFIGKGGTWLARSVAHELGLNLRTQTACDLNEEILSNVLFDLEQGDVFLIKNIHELKTGVTETLYKATKDFVCSVNIGKGKHQRTITIDLPSFTVIGTTSRPDLVSQSFRDSFSVFQLDQ